MIRFSKIIHKDELSLYINNKDIVKFEMLYRDNKALKNPNVYRIQFYVRINDSAFFNMLGLCNIAHKLNMKWKPGNKAFIGGIGSSKQHGFIKASVLEKMIKVEKDEKIKLGITEEFKETLKKWQ
jgi:hypothetical protein